MNLTQLVGCLCKSSIAVPKERLQKHHTYGVCDTTYNCVPLSSVLERATEENMIELDKMVKMHGYNLNTVISKYLDSVFVYFENGIVEFVFCYA